MALSFGSGSYYPVTFTPAWTTTSATTTSELIFTVPNAYDNQPKPRKLSALDWLDQAIEETCAIARSAA